MVLSYAMWKRSPKSQSGRYAFSLIELLGVLAIIMLLLALLFPSLRNARERAKQTFCTNQMRQIFAIAQSYRADYAGYLPAAFAGPNDNASQLNGMAQLQLYYAGVTTSGNTVNPEWAPKYRQQFFVCASDLRPHRRDRSYGNLNNTSYGFNDHAWIRAWHSATGVILPKGTRAIKPEQIPHNSLKPLSTVIMFGDQDHSTPLPNPGSEEGMMKVGSSTPLISRTPFGTYVQYNIMLRHDGFQAGNFMFFDGHTESIPYHHAINTTMGRLDSLRWGYFSW